MMKPRGFVLMSFIPHLIGAALLAGALWWAWDSFQSYCTRACEEQRDIAQAAILRVGVLEEAIAVAQKRATDLALMWSEAVQRVEQRHEVAQQQRVQRFAVVRERAGSIRHATDSVRVSVPRDAVRVLDDAYRASGGEAPAPAPVSAGAGQTVPAPAVDTTLTEWVAFAVDAAEAYRDATSKLSACREWAGAITQADLPPSPSSSSPATAL